MCGQFVPFLPMGAGDSVLKTSLDAIVNSFFS